jgi:Rrf2 family protein
MAVNTQFSIAVHMMAGLAYRCGKSTTSGELAGSVNTSPSFVRRVLSKLSKAGLIKTSKGKTGACLIAKDACHISLLDIYKAIGAPKAFAIHKYPELKPCPVSCHIKEALENVLDDTQEAMEKSLKKITLAELLNDMKCK